jgi:hypothetical protein
VLVGVHGGTLEARVQALEAELAAVRRAALPRSRAVAAVDGSPPVEPEVQAAGPPVSDRRGVVKLLAASAAGAVAGVALKGQPVAADDGQPVVQGGDNQAQTATFLSASSDQGLVLWSEVGQGLETDGSYGNALFNAGGDSPVGLPAWAGTLWVDNGGNWWGATENNDDDGKWRKIIGPQTAGALHLLDSPKRVYDSRPGEPPNIDPKSPLSANTARAIDPKGNLSGVPPQARGVLITFTIAPLALGGFATAWPSGPWPGTSNVNFAAGQPIATTTVVGLGPDGKFLVQSNVSTNIVIDVVGYYL